jgi:hypothetical protein
MNANDPSRVARTEERPANLSTDERRIVVALIPVIEELIAQFSDKITSKVASFREEVLRPMKEQLAERDRFLSDLWLDLQDEQAVPEILAAVVGAFLGNHDYDLFQPAPGDPFDGHCHSTRSELLVPTPDKYRDQMIASVIRRGVVKGDAIVVKPIVSVYIHRPLEARQQIPKQTKKQASALVVRVNAAA